MGERENDGEEEEGPAVVDIATALGYITEGMVRLQDLVKVTKQLWDQTVEIIEANQGRVVHPSDPDAQHLATTMAHNVYNVARLLPLMGSGCQEMAKVCWDYVCAPEIQNQLTIDRLQEETGIPWQVMDAGPFVIFTPENVQVPDDISELDDE